MFLKPAHESQIIRLCRNFKNVLIDDFQHHPFLYRANVLQTSFFTKRKITNWKAEKLTIQILIYYLIDSCAGKVFRKIM